MRVVLDAPIGGLGDGLLFSTLPELYARNGDEVFISTRTKSRNAEVFDLLYARNPHIRGISDEGEVRAGIVHEREFFLNARKWENPIRLIESLHGFLATNDTPKIYYHPRMLESWSNRIFVDPASISQSFPASEFDAFFRHLLLPQEKEVFVHATSHGAHNGKVLPDYARFTPHDIYEYIDVIYSCNVFVCTESGSQSLAAAVRHAFPTYALCTTMHYNTRLYVYPNVRYTVTGALSPTYLANDLTADGVDPARFG